MQWEWNKLHISGGGGGGGQSSSELVEVTELQGDTNDANDKVLEMKVLKTESSVGDRSVEGGDGGSVVSNPMVETHV